MGRALSPPLALLLLALFPLASCAPLSSHIVNVSEYIPRLTHPHTFVPASMILRDIRLSAGYCCDLSCFCAELNNASVEPCGSIQDRLAALSPSLCASASHVSSSLPCPLSGAATLCNGGASCCTHSCNEPCTSKPDVCVCPCDHCSICSCCKRVENRHCWLRCTPCKKVWMMLDFWDQHGKLHSVNFSQNFTLNSARAQNFYNAHKGLSSIFGYFKPDDPSQVVYDPQTVSFRHGVEGDVFITATAFPLFTISVLLTGLLIALLLQKRRRADQRPFRIAWSVNRGLWIGIIWPLIVLLLILQFPGHTIRADSALSIFFPQILACIGWLPLLLMWLYHSMHPQL